MVLRLKVTSEPHPNVTEWRPCPYTYLDSRLHKLVLAYTPQNEVTDRIMAQVSSVLHLRKAPFPSEDDLIKAAVPDNANQTSPYLGGVIFMSDFIKKDGTLQLKKNVLYKIRLSYSPRVVYDPSRKLSFTSDVSWSTNFMFPPNQLVGPREDNTTCNGNPGYRREGFLAIQDAVDNAVVQEFLSGASLAQFRSTQKRLQRHPYPPYKKDNYVLVLQQQFPIIIMLSFVVIVLGIVRDIVLEKERRLKESMKMMGISNWLHWTAWFTKHFLFLLLPVALMTLFYCVKIDRQKGGVIAETNPVILFMYLMCFAVATITFCFATSVFFAKANTGAALSGILFFCMYLPYFFLEQRYTTLSQGAKLFACLDFQVAMAFGGKLLGMFEGVGSGIQISTLSSNVSVDDNFSMMIVLVMLLLDSLLHCLVAWYVEAVFPGEYGMPQPWYFPVLPSYWGFSNFKSSLSLGESIGVGQDPHLFEKEPNEQAGFYPPSGGSAQVNGFDIQQEIGQVRASLGLCPQHDVLFDNLTVEEHLIFFGLLKGVAGSEILAQCEEMLHDTELLPKLKARSKTLSGGMKRKLSVCIALIGNSKVVFLDEPSSGLDPNARRSIWTVLQKNRAGRTMVLSTHFMDEADLLGDRIAIMADGIVKCCGSSLFLKKKYGAGYHMVVVKESGCDVSQVSTVVESHIPGAELESNVGAELSYILPQGQVRHFQALFTELEARQVQLGISSFGASVTTMEEVFIRVGESNDDTIRERLHHQAAPRPPSPKVIPASPAISSSNSSNSTPVLTPGTYGAINGPFLFPMSRSANPGQANHICTDAPPSTNVQQLVPDDEELLLRSEPRMRKNNGARLHLQQFRAMLVKRMLHTLRNKLVTLSQLVVPLFYTIMGIVVIKTLPSFTAMPALRLNPSQFKTNFIPFAHNNTHPMVVRAANSYGAQFSGSSHAVNVHLQPRMNQNTTAYDYLKVVGKQGIASYNLRYQVAADFGGSDKSLLAVAYFNNQGFHRVPVFRAVPEFRVLPIFPPRFQGNFRPGIIFLCRSALEINNQGLGKDPTGFTMGFNLTFGMAFLASSFVLFLVRERSIKAKHIQFVSGVHPVNFWLSTLVWDLVNYMVPCLLVIAVFFIFSIDPFTKDLHSLYMILLFVLYGWAMLPYMYLFSFGFTVPSTAYVWITMFNIITGFCGEFCLHHNKNFLGWEKNGIGRMLFFLAIQGVVLWAVIAVVEAGVLQKIRHFVAKAGESPRVPRTPAAATGVQEDEDVVREKARINNLVQDGRLDCDKLVVHNLTKYYGSFLAVDGLSVGIPAGECFGLLGINGAGKTSTFMMLTGDSSISSGDAYLDSFSLQREKEMARKRLGYCPQFDALIGQLTGRETLTLFARLRGIYEEDISANVNMLMDKLLLSKFADRQCQTYSGGNKRKLSTAIALIGDPDVVFLDEPTTGMDPVARRMLWEVLASVRDSGKTLVLTSHSMEECEALCTRLAIMVNGQFRCLGSPQHLKNKFGEGYTITTKIAYPEDGSMPDLGPLREFMASTFSDCVLTDVHENMLHYHIKDTQLTWAQVFGEMERAQASFNLEDYLVSQTSLEQVFISFARMSREDVSPVQASESSFFRHCCYCCCLPLKEAIELNLEAESERLLVQNVDQLV
ncbi:ATP-binding cassette sub-family A member 3 [Elysia marginata]|uniref:ATP-binding cassette sub-family A member 3 n=1 Tax=Elysia marginata TaxID=1093978 RepID=A0AAV4HY72_9GAST|nr:ATP-binding cassette sub-family A member 3 [Elysia marginata]